MQLKPRKTSVSGPQSGFTLIELMIVLVIFALIAIPLIQYYTKYLQTQKRNTTLERIEEAVGTVRIYRPSTFAYPCPADRSLGPNDPNYGVENCAAFIALAVGACSPGGGMCKAAGSWNADGVAGNDPVLIGALPFRTLSKTTGRAIGVDGSLDGWGNKLTYVVSANTTKHTMPRNSISVSNDFKLGVITAVDEFGNNTAGIGMFDLDNADADGNPSTGRDGDGQFAVISHGRTGEGAFTSQGVLVAPCSATTLDRENCDNDSTFTAALGDYNQGGAGFFDDLTLFYRDQAGDLWGYMENPDPWIGGSTGHIRKLNLGRVGVNTGSSAVQAQLDVNGNIKAATTLSDFYCKKNGTACIPTRFLWDELTTPTTIATPSDPMKAWKNSCPSGQVMTHYLNGQAQCVAKVTIPPPPSGAVNCPLGTHIRGIITNGCIICSDENVYPSMALCNN